MKHIYVTPSLEIVDFKDPLMNLELPISQTPVDDEAAKGIDDVVDDEDGINPTEWHEEMTNAIED
jgi:hypothetical protein